MSYFEFGLNYVRVFVVGAALALTPFGAVRAAPDYTTLSVEQAGNLLRLVKSACLIVMGAPPDFHMTTIHDVTETLQQNLGVLDKNAPEVAPFRAASDDIDTVIASVNQIAAGDRHPVPFLLMFAHSQTAIDDLRPAFMDAGTLAGSDLEAAAKTLIELRISTEEIVRDLCFVSAGLDAKTAVLRLQKNLDEFTDLVGSLIEGNSDTGLAKAPTIQAKFALKEVLTKWKSLKPALEQSLGSESLEVSDIMLASVTVDSIVKALRKAQAHYIN